MSHECRGSAVDHLIFYTVAIFFSVGKHIKFIKTLTCRLKTAENYILHPMHTFIFNYIVKLKGTMPKIMSKACQICVRKKNTIP